MPFDKNEERDCITCKDPMKPEDTPSKYTQFLACKFCRGKEDAKPLKQLQEELVKAMELL